MPLAYTGELLHRSEHDMARVRGVDPSARLALVEAIASVLERTRAAVASVRAELISCREAAAQSLDFERASRIQSEIEGFEWVVSEQTVTLSEPLDFDVCGWSDGILVHFGFRAGRLCTWTQHACTQPDAQPHLAATPGAWFQFAERNAVLAACLAAPTTRRAGIAS
jgi:excinuclease UvrABC nuclease subunit